MASPRPYCYECGTDLNPGESTPTAIQMWVFPASDEPEGSLETLETLTVDLCARCAADFNPVAAS